MLQAFAVRAACFVGELDVPYSEEFDGHDFSATHIIAYVGNEPAGAVRVRWFQSFAMPERLAVLQRFRGHNIGQLLLERCRTLAVSRGCNMLYVQALPADVKYWEKQGWRRLVAEGTSSGPKHIVAMVRAGRSSAVARGRAPELSRCAAKSSSTPPACRWGPYRSNRRGRVPRTSCRMGGLSPVPAAGLGSVRRRSDRLRPARGG